ncbi:uncharacterized protein [Panulirus ornatus]|uniref:uncharacterized protein n=1 Tax=Panulirus ornatus TaxID=150431 RepID=UPI003A8BA0CE
MLLRDVRKKGHEEAQTLATLTKSCVAPVARSHQEMIMIPLEKPEATLASLQHQMENSYEEVLAVRPANPDSAGATSSHHEAEAVPCEPPPAEGVLFRPLRPLRCLLTVVGVAPQVYDATTGEFRVSWRRLASLHVLFTATYLVVITTVTTISLCRHLAVRPAVAAATEDRSVKVIFVAIVGGYQINALVQVLNTVYAGRRYCRLLNSWNLLAREDGINPTRGLYLKSCVQVGFVVSFIVVMLVLATIGVPAILPHVLDGLAEWMFMVPPSWLTHSTPSAKVLLPHSWLTHSTHSSIVLLPHSWLTHSTPFDKVLPHYWLMHSTPSGSWLTHSTLSAKVLPHPWLLPHSLLRYCYTPDSRTPLSSHSTLRYVLYF